VVAAFAAIYLIWGSTYLAIAYAVETFPPFLMMGTRFLAAGAVLYAWAVARGAGVGTSHAWRRSAGLGLLLVAATYGLVGWAEMRLASGVVALLIATVAAWIVLFEAVIPGGTRPTRLVVVGVALGFVGQYVLIRPELARGARADLLSVGAVLLANVAWAAGSIAARRLTIAAPPVLATSMQMLAGGAVLCVVGLAVGEGARIAAAPVSGRSLLAWAYLVGPGSMLAYTAYVWLLGVVPPARVATSAYVNPVVAVALGWLLAGEPVTASTIAALGITLGGVLLINVGAGPARA
jgi:drug/metabolite transporter (DMT)-like permease